MATLSKGRPCEPFVGTLKLSEATDRFRSFVGRTLALRSLVTVCVATVFSLLPTRAYSVVFMTTDSTIDYAIDDTIYVGLDSHYSKEYSNTVSLVTGGAISGQFEAFGSGSINISGGSVGGMLQFEDAATGIVSGGSIGDYLVVNDNSKVRISGGSFGKGGMATDPANFFAGYGGGITLVGTSLSISNPRSDGNIYFIGMEYDLSGSLLDGTDLTGYIVDINAGSTLTLESIPEPATLSLIALGGLGLLLLRRK